jgi:hypothetical protein
VWHGGGRFCCETGHVGAELKRFGGRGGPGVNHGGVGPAGGGGTRDAAESVAVAGRVRSGAGGIGRGLRFFYRAADARPIGSKLGSRSEDVTPTDLLPCD